MKILDYWVYLCSYLVRSQKSLTLFDCKLGMYFTYICMAFHSNLETDYSPDYYQKCNISNLENPREKIITYLESS